MNVRLMIRRPALIAATLMLGLVLVAVVTPSALVSHPDTISLVNTLSPPSTSHLLGTDELGRDTLARIVYGARPSMLVGLGATTLGGLLGIVWGLTAALGGKVVDEVAMRAADVLLAFPSILLALLVVAVLGPSTRNVAVAVGAALSPGFARIVRVQALVVRRMGYVQAATILGLSPRTVIARHVLPNVLGPLLVLATMTVGTSIVTGASLSFLGLGTQPPAPEWGAMLSEARNYLGQDLSLAVFPGLAITLTVIAIGVIGRELQQRFEARVAA
jgi:peptide/nickel transport system permease protein